MSLSDVVAILNAVLSFLGLVVVGYLTFLVLRFTATPKIHIHMKVEADSPRSYLYVNELAILRFHLENVGHYYAKPAASEVVLYINFDSSFSIIEANYGTTLELTQREVKKGKRGGIYVAVTGIELFYDEGGEDVIVELRVPEQAGEYSAWIAARCSSSDLGLHKFLIQVRAN